jgi:hypothetical protein
MMVVNERGSLEGARERKKMSKTMLDLAMEVSLILTSFPPSRSCRKERKKSIINLQSCLTF